MKLMIILLMVTASHVIDVQSQKTQNDRTEKRELSKGNSAVDKRTPAISTVSPAITPGIEYADSKESQQDKSPTHETCYSGQACKARSVPGLLVTQAELHAICGPHIKCYNDRAPGNDFNLSCT